MKRDLREIVRTLGLNVPDGDVERAQQLAHAERDLMDALLEARRSQGLTQQDVADRMGVKQSTVARLEAPDANPTLGTLRRYAHAVGALMVHKVEADHGQLQDPMQRDFWMSARVDREATLRVAISAADLGDRHPLGGGATFRGNVTVGPRTGASFDLAA